MSENDNIRTHETVEEQILEECLSAMKVIGRDTQNLLVSGNIPLMKCDDFSTLKQLLRVEAYELIFAQVLKPRIKKADMPTSLSITADDIAN